GSVARGDSEGIAQSGGLGSHRSRLGSERYSAALPAGGRALALSPRKARPRSLPRRRYGIGQDHSNTLVVAGVAKAKPRRTATKSSGCTRFASRQLGVGTGAVCAEFEFADRSSFGAARSRSHDARARASAGCRSGDYELRLVAANSMARGSLLALGFDR